MIGRVDPAWQFQGLGDFNGDGNSDLLYRDPVSGEEQVILVSADGRSLEEQAVIGTIDPEETMHFAAVADFDGNGHADILWEKDNGGYRVWFVGTDGLSIVSDEYFGWVDLKWRLIDSGDYNGDGKSDLLYRDDSNGQQLVYLASEDGHSLATKHWLGYSMTYGNGWNYFDR